MRRNSLRTRAAARSSRSRFARSLSQPLAPDGCGSGTTGVPPRSKRSPTYGVSDRDPEQLFQREPADGDDETRLQQLELPLAPERA